MNMIAADITTYIVGRCKGLDQLDNHLSEGKGVSRHDGGSIRKGRNRKVSGEKLPAQVQ
jgi:hypothetical protein